MGKFNSLFQPLEVRRCTIPNRIVMTPMGTNFAESTGEIWIWKCNSRLYRYRNKTIYGKYKFKAFWGI